MSTQENRMNYVYTVEQT